MTSLFLDLTLYATEASLPDSIPLIREFVNAYFENIRNKIIHLIVNYPAIYDRFSETLTFKDALFFPDVKRHKYNPPPHRHIRRLIQRRNNEHTNVDIRSNKYAPLLFVEKLI